MDTYIPPICSTQKLPQSTIECSWFSQQESLDVCQNPEQIFFSSNNTSIVQRVYFLLNSSSFVQFKH